MTRPRKLPGSTHVNARKLIAFRIRHNLRAMIDKLPRN